MGPCFFFISIVVLDELFRQKKSSKGVTWYSGNTNEMLEKVVRIIKN